MLACLGQAVEQDERVHAIRNWRNQLIVFDDVDVMLTIEIDVGSEKFPLVHTMRGINRRSALDIHREIRAIEANPAGSLAVALGGIAQKPGVVDGRVEIREYLSVTLSFDHDILDGAPAARFAAPLCAVDRGRTRACPRRIG